MSVYDTILDCRQRLVPACRFSHPILVDLAFHAPAPAMRVGFTTICVPTELHQALEARKVHPRQAYHEVISTVLRNTGGVRKRRG